MIDEIWKLIESNLRFHYIQGDLGVIRRSWSFDWRSRPCALLFHIQNGEMELQFEECGEWLSLRHDDILFIPPNMKYRQIVKPAPIMSVNWIHCQALVCGGIDLLTLLPSPIRFQSPETGTLIETIRSCVVDNKTYWRKPSLALLIRKNRLAFDMLQAIVEAEGVESIIAPSLAKLNRVRPVIEYLDMHFAEPVQRKDLARLMNLSVSRCDALFKEVLGEAPLDYLINKRMEIAKIKLFGTSLSVSEIASQVGYDDSFYFSRLFKKRNGITPSDYRRNLGAISIG